MALICMLTLSNSFVRFYENGSLCGVSAFKNDHLKKNALKSKKSKKKNLLKDTILFRLKRRRRLSSSPSGNEVRIRAEEVSRSKHTNWFGSPLNKF